MAGKRKSRTVKKPSKKSTLKGVRVDASNVATAQESSRNADGTFKQGFSGNPGGAIKRDWTWASLIADAVEKMGKDNKGLVKAQIVDRLLAKAAKGDLRAAEMLMDRMDGKPHQTIAQTTETKAEVRVIE